MTLYTKKIHLAGLFAWEMRLKRCRRVCKSPNICPHELAADSHMPQTSGGRGFDHLRAYPECIPSWPGSETLRQGKVVASIWDIWELNYSAMCLFRKLANSFAIVLNTISQNIFTDIDHWADSVLESQCPSACHVCVCFCAIA